MAPQKDKVISKERIIDLQPVDATFPTSGTLQGDAVPAVGKQARTTTNVKNLTPVNVSSMSTIQQFQNQAITPQASHAHQS